MQRLAKWVPATIYLRQIHHNHFRPKQNLIELAHRMSGYRVWRRRIENLITKISGHLKRDPIAAPVYQLVLVSHDEPDRHVYTRLQNNQPFWPRHWIARRQVNFPPIFTNHNQNVGTVDTEREHIIGDTNGTIS